MVSNEYSISFQISLYSKARPDTKLIVSKNPLSPSRETSEVKNLLSKTITCP